MLKLSAILLMISSLAPAADWPQFRGSAQGHADEASPPMEWSATKNCAWRVALPGKGWSSPVIAKGVVYVTTAVLTKGGNEDDPQADRSLRAIALDAKTGKILWDKEIFKQDGATAPPIHAKNSHASPTIAVKDGKLYAHFGHQGTAALDLTGKVLWTNRELKYSPVHGGGSHPVVVKDVVVFNADGGSDPFVAALDAATGKLRWKFPRPTTHSRTFSFSTPIVIESEGQQQLVSPGSGMVNALNPADGKEIWRVNYAGFSVVPQPVHGHGMVFVSSGYEAPELVAFKLGGKGDLTKNIVWTASKRVPTNPSFLLIGEELYTHSDNGIATCYEAKTGKIHWQERATGPASASPVAVGNRLYLLDEGGGGVVLQAGKEFRILARNDLGERALASMAVVDKALFVRTEEALYCFAEK